ncbi:competence protein [Weizmannia acidilactici]|uniref:Competence protein n=2 Tax=Weizmannia acidilactici TaxID=2607726 RepID=A0A5J4J6B3_9BACI|nr:competence protein [Weizmannia acidilactici]GER70466.1 competence protein [Weizmannia acidilactici]GER72633.1 competence protein [Weizmannia acidilactici]
MLSALNQRGELVMLTKRFTRNELQNLRASNTFYCRDCREPLILKIGNQITPHFSHYRHSDCVNSSEPESPMHLQGKKDLYLWLKGQDLEVTLEQYIPSIQQRADLLVRKNGQLFAVEYQCSPIPFRQIMKRTEGYKSLNILPVWILGGYPCRKEAGKGPDVFTCTDFQLYFLRYIRKHYFYLFSYFPKKQALCMLFRMVPASSRRFHALYDEKPLSSFAFPFTDVQFHTKTFPLSLVDWFSERRNWIRMKVQFGKAFLDPFLRQVYESGLHPLFLPSFIGLPLKQMAICKQHPVVWQFYVWKDFSSAIMQKACVSLDEMVSLFFRRVGKKEIELRKTPFVHEKNVVKVMLFEYAQTLTRLGYWEEAGKTKYMMNKNICFPKNMEELDGMEHNITLRLPPIL